MASRNEPIGKYRYFMYNTNWPLNSTTSTSNVDWSALADSWMQQREQQAQWQHHVAAAAPPAPPPPPPPPPPQFLLTGPPIPPPGPPPIGMPPFPPFSTNHPMVFHPQHHQLQVGSNIAQESLTITNIENSPWRSGPVAQPPMMMPVAPPQLPQWRPTTNNPSIFPIQPEIQSPYPSRNFWPPVNNAPPPPPPPPPPLPPPPPAPAIAPPPPLPQFIHSPVEKRSLNTSLNTSIPSLMDLPPSYRKNSSGSVTPSVPIVPSVEIKTSTTTSTPPTTNRRKIPAWLRDALGNMEKEKEKKSQNTTLNTSHSINDVSMSSVKKFDDDHDDDDDNESEDDIDPLPSESNVNASTPLVNRRSRFDDEKSDETELNVSQIARRSPSTSPSSSPPNEPEDEQIDREEEFMIKLRRNLTELLLDVTNEELSSIAKEVFLQCKAESSTPVIRKASALSSLIQSFSASDSDSNDETNVDTKSKTSSITSIKSETNQTNSSFVEKKTKKSVKDRSRSPSIEKHHQKKKSHHHHRRRHSSSSSSSSSPHSSKKKKSSSSKYYDNHGRKQR